MSARDYALYLAGEHELPVFPCKTNKAPYTARGFKDATTDPASITGWWTQFPDALVGVPTGSSTNLLVIDIDPDGADWYTLKSEKLKCGRIHKTRRGWHLLYQMPEGVHIKSAPNTLSKGVDTRADGAYIIWWAAHGLETVGDMTDIGPPPKGLVVALTRRPPPPVRLDDVRPSSEWERIVSEGAPSGARNHTLARLTGFMLSCGVPAKVTRAWCHMWAAERCQPPMDPNEAEITIASIVRADKQRLANEQRV